MVKTCVYCAAQYKPKCSRTFHCFPVKEPERLQKWIQNLEAVDLKITKTTRICSDHFEQKWLRKENGKVLLQPGSVPTLFGECQLACAYCKVKKRHGKRTFHRFPMLRPAVLQQWMANFPQKSFKPSEKSLLCARHFQTNCYYASGQLKPTAVPSLFHSSELAANSSTNDVTVVMDLETELGVASGSISSLESVPPKKMKIAEEAPESEEHHTSEEVNTTLSQQEISISSPAAANNCSFKGNSESVTHQRLHAIRSRISHDHQYEPSFATVLQKLTRLEKKVAAQEKIIRAHKKKVSRMKTKLTNLMDIVSDLKDNTRVSEKALRSLTSLGGIDVSDFLTRFVYNTKHQKISREQYSPSLRSFALTLHYYSPKVYEYVRKKFGKALPDASILQSWYSSIDGEAGFTTEGFEALKVRARESKEGKKV